MWDWRKKPATPNDNVPVQLRFFVADPLSSEESLDKSAKDTLNKSINESQRKGGDEKVAPSKSVPKKKKNKKEKDAKNDAEQVWVGKTTEKKDKKKGKVRPSEDQLLDYAAKAKIQELFLYLFFLITTTVRTAVGCTVFGLPTFTSCSKSRTTVFAQAMPMVTVVMLGSAPAGALYSDAVRTAFMKSSFTNLANETRLLQNFVQHQVEPDYSQKRAIDLLKRWEERHGKRNTQNLKDSVKPSPSTGYDQLRSLFDGILEDDKNNNERNNEEPDLRSVPLDGYDLRGFLVDAMAFSSEKTLEKACNMEDFWSFLQTTFINVLYWDNWYSNEDPIDETTGEDKQLLFSSQLLGVPRLRQVKVRSDSCTINPTVRHYFNSCITYFSSSVEDMSPIKPKNTVKLTIPAWEHAPPSETKAFSTSGKFSNYGPGGFYFDLTRDKESTKEIIKELRDNDWVTRATRAVILYLTFYNANVNLFLYCRFTFEMPPTGGVYPFVQFVPVQLYRYMNTADFVVLGAELIFILFLIYFSVLTLLKIGRKGIRHLTEFGGILMLIVILLGWACVAQGFYRYFAIEPAVSDLIRRHFDTYPNFEAPVNFQFDFNSMLAALLFLVWMRGILYLKHCSWILPSFRTVGDAENRNALLGLTLLFSAMLFAMAQLGYLVFGEQSKQFSTLRTSIATLFIAVIGQIDYLEMERINAPIAGVFFILYTFIVFFILLMLFAAVVAHAYEMAVASVPPIKDRIITSYLTFVLTFGIRGGNSDDDRTLQHIRSALSRAGYTELEIDMFFSKFGVEHGKKLTDEKKAELVEKLGERKFQYENIGVTPQTVAYMLDELCRLKHLVEEASSEVKKSGRQMANAIKAADDVTKDALNNLECGPAACVEQSIPPHDVL